MPGRSLFSVAAALLVLACSSANQTVEAGGTDMNRSQAAGADAASNDAGIEGQPTGNDEVPVDASADASASLLANSAPADGARLTSSPSNLLLAFRSPVRLQEVTVATADGQTIPMMVTAAGLARSYSIPVTDLEPGSYTVTWRATDSAGRSHEGRFGFVVR